MFHGNGVITSFYSNWLCDGEAIEAANRATALSMQNRGDSSHMVAP